MSLKARWVVDPKVESFFWEHTPSPHKSSISHPAIEELRASTRKMLEQSRNELLEMGFTEDLLEGASQSIDTLCQASLLMQKYRAERISIIPRFLQPNASRLLAQKNEANAKRKLRLQLLNQENQQMSHLFRSSAAHTSIPAV